MERKKIEIKYNQPLLSKVEQKNSESLKYEDINNVSKCNLKKKYDRVCANLNRIELLRRLYKIGIKNSCYENISSETRTRDYENVFRMFVNYKTLYCDFYILCLVNVYNIIGDDIIMLLVKAAIQCDKICNIVDLPKRDKQENEDMMNVFLTCIIMEIKRNIINVRIHEDSIDNMKNEDFIKYYMCLCDHGIKSNKHTWQCLKFANNNKLFSEKVTLDVFLRKIKQTWDLFRDEIANRPRSSLMLMKDEECFCNIFYACNEYLIVNARGVDKVMANSKIMKRKFKGKILSNCAKTYVRNKVRMMNLYEIDQDNERATCGSVSSDVKSNKNLIINNIILTNLGKKKGSMSEDNKVTKSLDAIDNCFNNIKSNEYTMLWSVAINKIENIDNAEYLFYIVSTIGKLLALPFVEEYSKSRMHKRMQQNERNSASMFFNIINKVDTLTEDYYTVFKNQNNKDQTQLENKKYASNSVAVVSFCNFSNNTKDDSELNTKDLKKELLQLLNLKDINGKALITIVQKIFNQNNCSCKIVCKTENCNKINKKEKKNKQKVANKSIGQIEAGREGFKIIPTAIAGKRDKLNRSVAATQVKVVLDGHNEQEKNISCEEYAHYHIANNFEELFQLTYCGHKNLIDILNSTSFYKVLPEILERTRGSVKKFYEGPERIIFCVIDDGDLTEIAGGCENKFTKNSLIQLTKSDNCKITSDEAWQLIDIYGLKTIEILEDCFRQQNDNNSFKRSSIIVESVFKSTIKYILIENENFKKTVDVYVLDFKDCSNNNIKLTRVSSILNEIFLLITGNVKYKKYIDESICEIRSGCGESKFKKNITNYMTKSDTEKLKAIIDKYEPVKIPIDLPNNGKIYNCCIEIIEYINLRFMKDLSDFKIAKLKSKKNINLQIICLTFKIVYSCMIFKLSKYNNFFENSNIENRDIYEGIKKNSDEFIVSYVNIFKSMTNFVVNSDINCNQSIKILKIYLMSSLWLKVYKNIISCIYDHNIHKIIELIDKCITYYTFTFESLCE